MLKIIALMTILVSDHPWYSIFSGVLLSNSLYVSANGLFQTVVQMEKMSRSATQWEQEGAAWIKYVQRSSYTLDPRLICRGICLFSFFSGDNPIIQSFSTGREFHGRGWGGPALLWGFASGPGDPTSGPRCPKPPLHTKEMESPNALYLAPRQSRRQLADFQLPVGWFIRETKLMLVKFGKQIYYSLRTCSLKFNFYKVEVNTDLLKILKRKRLG